VRKLKSKQQSLDVLGVHDDKQEISRCLSSTKEIFPNSSFFALHFHPDPSNKRKKHSTQNRDLNKTIMSMSLNSNFSRSGNASDQARSQNEIPSKTDSTATNKDPLSASQRNIPR
jgi:hypothetical protein